MLACAAGLAPGTAWASERAKASTAEERLDFWSLRPVEKPLIPELEPEDRAWVRNPVDAFILAKLREKGLGPSPEADRRTLIRRAYFDLIGLPPSIEAVEAFVNSEDPKAYEKLIDSLLASPGYGERWARHWLDVVHYGDTHGYDKDKMRPNAWPYRDYVVRAFNEDKPYGRFVMEQIAGDVLFPGTVDALVATGFIAAGPWDFIGHAEVPEEKIDGKVARNLDRDDMVSNVMNTFTSMTVQCARCHEHKFDPVSQEDYYSLQAVFAALDRADRSFDTDPAVARKRAELTEARKRLAEARKALEEEIRRAGGKELEELEKRIAELSRARGSEANPAFGYHSAIETSQDTVKWVQVDLGAPIPIHRIVLVGAHDTFNNLGAGFGFPVRYKIEISDDPEFAEGVVTVEDRTGADAANPGVEPQPVQVGARTARFVRVTATKLAKRADDYIFALGELRVEDAEGRNRAFEAKVRALDSIESPPRWRKQNLVDGHYHGIDAAPETKELLVEAKLRRKSLLDRLLTESQKAAKARLEKDSEEVEAELEALPEPMLVYAGMVYTGSGAFRGTGADGGKPRPIHVLLRGNVQQPMREVGPGTVDIIPGVAPRFDLPEGHTEGERRAALARWVVHERNPLTWRSIVNRVWLYHFGRGIVDTPNDFGRMGGRPSHPELLDWLAAEFRDGKQSLKDLHRLLMTSSTYRQSSVGNPACEQIDSGNEYLWRMNRRRLEAEAIRDSVLAVSGKLDRKMYGPGFQDFVVEKPEHSPHYQYHLHNPEDPKSHRRSIYRFIVRSQQQPFMTTLDCADPSMLVDKRNESLSALQALALLNNPFMVTMSRYFAERLEGMGGDLENRIEAACRLALSRPPKPEERERLVEYAREHGLANMCRLIFNLNEFMFID